MTSGDCWSRSRRARRLHLARRRASQKRGGGAVRDEAALGDRDGSAAEDAALDQLLGASPPPHSPPRWPRSASGCWKAWEMPTCARSRSAKMEGYTTEEIAAKLRRAPRTVERKLDLIRRRWTA